MGSGRMRSKGCKAVAMVRTIRGPGCTCTRCAMDGSCRLGCTRNVTVGAHRAVGGGGGMRMGSRPPATIRQCCRWHVVHRARNATDSGRTWVRSSATCGLRVEVGRVGSSRVTRTISRSVSEGDPSAIASRTTRTRSPVPS